MDPGEAAGLGVRGGKVNPPKGGSSAAGSKQSVSGSSQLIASSVSSGPVTKCGKRGMFSPNAQKALGLMLLCHPQ